MTRSIPYPYTTQDARQWIGLNTEKKESDPTKVWAIRSQMDQQVEGMIGVYRLFEKDTVAEVGYWVGKDSWGKGLATQALQTLIDHLQSQYGFASLIAHTFEKNPASGRVLEKNKFVREKKVSPYMVKNDEVIDAILWRRTF